tara:strand:+ start:162 stop:524 length:363 start_codon:yes stop_codon:yes gene_type:complete
MPTKQGNPDLWFFFDLRGEYHGHVTTGENDKGILMLKKGEYDDFLIEIGEKLGSPQDMDTNIAVPDVDVNDTKKLFDDEGFTVTKATDDDFDEIKRELDKLETIKGGESKKYKSRRRITG